MNLSNQIQTWLEDDGFYPVGVNLLLQTGVKVHLFQHYLNTPWVPASVEQRLRYELVSFLESHPPIITENKSTGDQRIKTKANTTPAKKPIQITRPEDPVEVQELRLQAKILHKKHDHLKARLVLMCQEETKFTNQERYEVSDEIMRKVIPELDRIYADIRKYEEDDIIPPLKSFSVVAREVIQMMNKRKSLKERISKVKGLIRKNLQLSLEDIEKYKQEMAEKSIAVEVLEEKLGI